MLRTYQSQFSGRTARTADLQRLFEAELGQPLDYFLGQWYRGQGYPRFDVRWRQVGGSLYLQVAETASTPAATPFFQTEVDYQLTFQDGSTRVVRLGQTQVNQGFSLAVSGIVTAIAVDPDGWLPDLPGTVQPDPALVLATRPAAAPALALFPNPCRDQLKVSNLPSAAATAEVCDATGRLVLRQALPPLATAIATGALAPGLYLLRLLGPAGQPLGQSRFIRTSD